MNTRFSLLLCAIIISITTSAQISINSEPSGAKVYQEGKYIGTTPCTASSNMKAKQLVYDIDADRVRDPSQPPYSIEFTITMDGYEPATVYFEGKYEYHQSGFRGQNKYYIVQPKSYKLFAVLKKDQSVSSNDGQTTVPQTQQVVIQEKNTEVRWHFDSDPEGARIYWRVKSLDSDIVKNTDLLYLGITPFNELKPFNIKGLNSENAKNVIIEVEIIKKGYKKQTKSISAESLTEQQEISWFFELEEEQAGNDTIKTISNTEEESSDDDE